MAQVVVGLVISVAATLIANALTPDVEQEGPRLGDQRLTTSTLGSDIPIGYGTNRFGGNIFWAEKLDEVRNVDRTGGKGGPGVKSTTYQYFANFAIGIQEGPMTGFLRIWADSKLIYDATGNSDVFYKYPGSELRFYLGTSTQLPDPLIQADVGVANTPAYRNMAYVVFERFPVADFGNRIPQFTFETANDTSPLADTGTITDTTTFNREADQFSFNSDYQFVYFPTDTKFRIGLLDMFDETYIETEQFPFSDSGSVAGGLNPDILFGHTDGKLFVFGAEDSLPFQHKWLELNPFTLDLVRVANANVGGTITNRFIPGCSLSFTAPTTAGIKNYSLTVQGDLAGQPQDTVMFLFDRDRLFAEFAGTYKFSRTPLDYVDLVAATVDRDGDVWIIGRDTAIAADASGRQSRLYHFRVETIVDFLGTTSKIRLVEEIDMTQHGLDTPLQDQVGIAYHEPSHSLIILGADDSSNDFTWVRWDIATQAVLNTRTLNSLVDTTLVLDAVEARCTHHRRLEDGFLRVPKKNASGEILKIQVTDFNNTSLLADFGETTGAYHYDGLTNTSWHFPQAASGSSIEFNRHDRLSDSPVTLESIIDDLMARADIPIADYSVDASITAAMVQGYPVTRQAAVRQALEPLAFAFQFGEVESDGIIKFISKGAASVRTIPIDELGAVPDGKGSEEQVLETRLQEVEMPQSVNIRYTDRDRDHQEGDAEARRHRFPTPTNASKSARKVTSPVVQQADFARQLAETSLYGAWLGRTSYEYSLTADHLDLDAMDVVTIADGADSLMMRIGEVGLGEGLISEMKALSDDPEIYLSTITGDAGTVGAQAVNLPGPSEPFLMDLPLLRDQDAPGQSNSGMYLGVGALRAAWSGATLERSEDGTNYEVYEIANGESPWGSLKTSTRDAGDTTQDGIPAVSLTPTTGKLPSCLIEFDRDLEILVDMISGTSQLSSVTENEVLGGNVNAAVIFNDDRHTGEVIQYANITDNGDGTATLDTILRGRRGTELEALDGHSKGARVVFIDPTWTTRKELPLTDRSVERIYRATSLGRISSEGIVRTLTLTSEDLLPYPVTCPVASPEHTGAARGTVSLTWVRQTRTGGFNDMQDEVSDTPLGETSESYDVVLLDKATGLIESVEKVVGAEATSFDLTDIVTTAGYTDGDELNIVIYQNSDVVGRGKARAATL